MKRESVRVGEVNPERGEEERRETRSVDVFSIWSC